MEDIEIIKALLNGNHLNGFELERGGNLLFLLNIELERRIKD